MRSARFHRPGGDGVARRVHADPDDARALSRRRERFRGKEGAVRGPERVASRLEVVLAVRVRDDQVAGGVEGELGAVGFDVRFRFQALFFFFQAFFGLLNPTVRIEANGRLECGLPRLPDGCQDEGRVGAVDGFAEEVSADQVGEGFRRIGVDPGHGDDAAGTDRDLDFAGRPADRCLVNLYRRRQRPARGLGRHTDLVSRVLELPPDDVEVSVRRHRHPRFRGQLRQVRSRCEGAARRARRHLHDAADSAHRLALPDRRDIARRVHRDQRLASVSAGCREVARGGPVRRCRRPGGRRAERCDRAGGGDRDRQRGAARRSRAANEHPLSPPYPRAPEWGTPMFLIKQQ